jgi:hypothetical protein
MDVPAISPTWLCVRLLLFLGLYHPGRLFTRRIYFLGFVNLSVASCVQLFFLLLIRPEAIASGVLMPHGICKDRGERITVFQEWWRVTTQFAPKQHRQAFNSLVILVALGCSALRAARG